MTDIQKKELRKMIKEVIKNNNGNCSVCKQNLFNSEQFFAKMRGIKLTWGETDIYFFIPHEITFSFAYSHIIRYAPHRDKKGLEIVLIDDKIISLRGF